MEMTLILAVGLVGAALTATALLLVVILLVLHGRADRPVTPGLERCEDAGFAARGSQSLAGR